MKKIFGIGFNERFEDGLFCQLLYEDSKNIAVRLKSYLRLIRMAKAITLFHSDSITRAA